VAIGPEQDLYNAPPWMNILSLTSLATSMAVNALMTGLIVFKILKVFLEFKPTSVEQTLGSLSSTGRSKLGNIIFIIIESGMALFAVQLVRVVFSFLEAQHPGYYEPSYGMELVIGIQEMFNVIILRSVHSTTFVLLMTFTWLGHRANNNFGADPNVLVLR
jgi:hypothetical protein